MTPKPGDEFLIAHFRFHNFRGSTTDVASTAFSSKSKGIVRNAQSASSLTNNALGTSGASVAPHSVLTADIVFQIAKGDTQAQIIYAPNGSGGDKAIWTIRG